MVNSLTELLVGMFLCTFRNELEKIGGSVFFLGSTSETLQKIKQKYNKEFPHVSVGTYSPPFEDNYSEEDNHKIIDSINAFQPDVLFVGMTAPKQEIWSYHNKKKINAKIISTIGNVFDWYAGNTKRPGIFWQKIGLEWFVRIFYRPEIFKRNIGNQMIFFWHLLLSIMGFKKYD